MKRLFLALLASGALLLLCPAFASQAMAATTTSVSMTFLEPIVPDIHSGCGVVDVRLCGHGQVAPYGQATETIVFGGACGGSCDLRTITGTYRVDGQASTGIFAGARGTGHVTADVTTGHETVSGTPIGVLGDTHSGAPQDSGLVACTYPLATQDVPATAYPKIRAEFAGSRWPDLRTAGTAYVDLAVALRTARGTDGYETVWFYQRLSAACAKHRQ